MNFRPARAGTPDVSIVPLIDVVFLLLLFFILTTTFRHLDFLSVQLAEPAAAESEERPDTCLRLALDAEGAVYLNRRALPRAVAAREQALAAALAETPNACVHAHALTPHGAVIEMMTRLRYLGAGEVRLGAIGEHLP